MRNTLSLIVDGLSRHLAEMDASTVIMIREMHSVLALSLLLVELLLLQVVESIPPPTGINLDPEREALTTRIDVMCGEMLGGGFGNYSHQLTRSLMLLRLTMGHARELGQTYNAWRNAMLPSVETDRVELLCSIGRSVGMICKMNEFSENRNMF